jgi:hypothetical protein
MQRVVSFTNVRTALLLSALVCAPTLARAQDFGVLQSAETINKGNFKLRASPMVVFGKGQDSQLGAAILFGYGFTPRVDAEGGVAFFDGRTFFGGNVEVWVVQRNPFDFSISAGLHGHRGSQALDSTGVDLTFLPSKRVNEKLDVYGALDFAFESISDKFGGGSFKTVHFVPGIEYRLHPDLDVIAELGIGLNDAARHYISGGFAFYFR